MVKIKSVIHKSVALVVAAVLCLGGFNDSVFATSATEPFYTEVSLQNWVCNERRENDLAIDFSSVTTDGKITDTNTLILMEGNTLSFDLTVTDQTVYQVFLSYRFLNSSSVDSEIYCSVDGEDIGVATLHSLWTDESRDKINRSGDEMVPSQVFLTEFRKGYLIDVSDINKSNMDFELTAGIHTVSLKSQVMDFEIEEIYLISTKFESYSEPKGFSQENIGDDIVTIEGEDYSIKSDSYIRGKNMQDKSLAPYDTYNKKINVLYGSSWSKPGQKVLWEFDIETSGWYRIGLHYQQGNKNNIPIYRKIEIDGKVPFSDWEALAFDATSSNKYENTILESNGESAWIYLDAGMHTISMTVTIGNLAEEYYKLLDLVDRMNEYGTQLLKLSAGVTDENRTWDMESYMPSAKEDILAFAVEIDDIYKAFDKKTENSPVFADDLKYASELLRRMTDDEKRIPNNTKMLCRGDNSSTTYLINVINNITNQALSIDQLYVFGKKEPKENKVSFFEKIIESLKRFFYSFTPESIAHDYGTNSKTEDEELDVWVGQSVLGVEILQNILDETYNKTNNSNIRLSIMPSEQKLILANAVGENPDVVLSVVNTVPFNFAIRNAAKNLLEYEDFYDYYTSQYSVETLVPMFYGEGIYGAVESRDFRVLYYRKDILEALELEVPNTWDDVKAMMPVLLRNSMNFSLPMSGNGSYSLSNTAPLIYQNDGSIYVKDGSKVAFDLPDTITGITEMTDLYKVYGVQQSVASFFNSFRYGQIPIGISTYTMYLQLKMGAPELSGLWDIALTPGTIDEDGEIVRYQPSNSTACMIFENTDKSEEAWDFLKWWLSSDVQTEYSSRRQTGYGAEYLWNTANKISFEELPFSGAQRQVIEEQFKQQNEIVNHPASYLVERELGNIWTNVVISGEALIDCINSSSIISNREIKRKLQEFGFIDENGNLIEDYTTDVMEKLNAMGGN